MNPILAQASELIQKMSRSENARVLKWVASDITDSFPGIEMRDDVCGGEPCVVRTRIPVWLLIKARKDGMSDGDILNAYPSLNAEDLVEAWAYARAHTDEIARQIHDNEST